MHVLLDAYLCHALLLIQVLYNTVTQPWSRHRICNHSLGAEVYFALCSVPD